PLIASLWASLSRAPYRVACPPRSTRLMASYRSLSAWRTRLMSSRPIAAERALHDWKKEGRLRRVAPSKVMAVAALGRQLGVPQTARNRTLWATSSRFFTALNQTPVSLLRPTVPGADSCRRVLKSALPSPTTCAPPPSTTFPAGHGTAFRLKPPLAPSGVEAPLTTS